MSFLGGKLGVTLNLFFATVDNFYSFSFNNYD